MTWFFFSDECARPDPPIGNIAKLSNIACAQYQYGKNFSSKGEGGEGRVIPECYASAVSLN